MATFQCLQTQHLPGGLNFFMASPHVGWGAGDGGGLSHWNPESNSCAGSEVINSNTSGLFDVGSQM